MPPGRSGRTRTGASCTGKYRSQNELLLAIADALDEHAADIEAANALDMLESKENGMDAGKLDRLLFDVPRVAAAAQGRAILALYPIRSARSCADTTAQRSAPYPDARADGRHRA